MLGTGFARCKSLENVTKEVISELTLNATIEKIEDIAEIMQSGVMNTPALIVNNEVIVAGYVPSNTEMKSFLSKI